MDQDEVVQGNIGDNAYKKLFEHRVTGMRATISGKLGEKKIDRINKNVNSDFMNPYLSKSKSRAKVGGDRYMERPKTS